MIPTFGLTSRFFIPSMRLLPGRSGISSVRSSSSCTNPGASPLGRTIDAGPVQGPDHQEWRCRDKGAPDLGDMVGSLWRSGSTLAYIFARWSRNNGIGIVPVDCIMRIVVGNGGSSLLDLFYLLLTESCQHCICRIGRTGKRVISLTNRPLISTNEFTSA